MIKYLSIENFYSIRNESIVEFDLNKSEDDFIAHPTLGFAGTNASGKTTFIKGLNFITWFISQSFFSKETKIPLEKFIGCEESPTKFSLIFGIEKEDYEYELEVNGNKVLSENLSINGVPLYSRSLKNVKFGNRVSEFSTNDLRDTSSIISYATNFDSHVEAIKIREYLGKIQTNVDSQGLKNIKFKPTDLVVLSQNETIKNTVIEIIKFADIGITDFFVENKEKHEIATILEKLKKDSPNSELLKDLEKAYNNDNLNILSAFFKHNISDFQTDFTEEKESSGTLQLFALISMILPKLETGGLVVLDEIETNLHQNLVAYLIGLFQNPEVNKGSAQLIFTFHNSLFMDILEPEQLWFAEKNNRGETELFCAANFDDIENIHKKSLEKLYRIGRFGAKPKAI
jgi:uncharacterized protein